MRGMIAILSADEAREMVTWNFFVSFVFRSFAKTDDMLSTNAS